MRFVDSHCHLYDLKDYEVPEDIVPVVVGYSHSSNRKAYETAKARGLPFVLGIAPQTAIRSDISRLEEWKGFIRECRPNAIGEVGLDFKWATTREDLAKERLVFRAMVELAKELDAPLVIHSRNNPLENEVPVDAIGEILGSISGMPFLMHFFSGTAEQAAKVIAMGGYISMTHFRSKERRKVINITPLDKLLVESDSPFVGRTPDVVREAVAYIAEVKGLGQEEVADATAANAARFFGFRV